MKQPDEIKEECDAFLKTNNQYNTMLTQLESFRTSGLA